MAATAGLFAGFGKSWKVILGCCLLLSCFPFSSALNVVVNGPDTGFAGDYEQFTCVVEGSRVDTSKKVEWMYKLKSGETKGITADDMISDLEARSDSTDTLLTSSFIRLASTDIAEIVCQYSTENAGSKPVEINGDFKAITADDEVCVNAGKSDKPLAVVQTMSLDFAPPYRKARYIDAVTFPVAYPTDVSQVQLTCISANGDAPTWQMKKEQASKMRFSVWAQDDIDNKNCKKQILHVYQVTGMPGATVPLSFSCNSNSASVDVKLEYTISGINRMIFDPNDNSTANCISEVVDKFYDKELTGVGVASSFAIVFMMVGIAVLKKQLNNQQNINKQLQGQTDPNGGGGGSAPQMHPGASSGMIA